jgi:CIC family chloride channel protein
MARLTLEMRAGLIRRRAVDFGTLFLLCALVGIIAGLGAAGFHYLLQLSQHLFMDGLAGYRPPGPLGEEPLFAPTDHPFRRWVLFLLPAAGGLASGAFVYWLAPEAEGHGTDAAIDAYHHKKGAIRARVPFVKTIASAITIGTGGSAGREGPIAQIGAGLGSNLALWLGLSTQQRRILLAAGLGAGIGAIFRAPLAGALFAGEVLYRGVDIEFEVITPAILASIVGYSTFGLMFGWQPLFATPNFAFRNPAELGPYLVLALFIALAGRGYAVVFYRIRDGFRALQIPQWLKPAVGGLGVGAISLVMPGALSTGFGVVQEAFQGHATAGFLFAVGVAKILATGLTVGSGGSGGVFGPAVVIGGALGGSVGVVFHHWWPYLVPDPGAFAMVGMAGFFASAAHVPISTVIMVSELTGNYGLLVPSMFVCIAGTLLVRNKTIYEQQLPSRADSPAHRREAILSILERLRVDDLLSLRPGTPPPTLQESTPLAAVLSAFASSSVPSMPVVDESGRLTGQINREVVQQLLGSTATPSNLVLARDIAAPVATITRGQSVYDALRTLSSRNLNGLLVLGDSTPSRVEAVLTPGDINAIYDEFLEEMGPDEPGGLTHYVKRWLSQAREEKEASQRAAAGGPAGR